MNFDEDIAKTAVAMTDFSEGNLHDIAHLNLVHYYARLIALEEKVDDDLRHTIELAALVHDIGCPLCRKLYGHTQGPYQEKEGAKLTGPFLKKTLPGLSDEKIARIAFIVGHHHSFNAIDGQDFQIVVEADYIVNAYESSYPGENMKFFRDNVFKNPSAVHLLNSMFGLD